MLTPQKPKLQGSDDNSSIKWVRNKTNQTCKNIIGGQNAKKFIE